MTPEGTPQRAGVYCRLSYAPDGSVEKVERQEADCRDLAARGGWVVSEAHVFADNSRSAWQRNRKRPGWDALLSAVVGGEIDGIIVYHGDRLMRQPYDLEKLISAADSKGLRIASVSGTRDLDNPDDRFILRIEVAQACRESDNTSRRVRRGLEARAADGLTQVGGHRPFGYGVQVGTRTRTDPDTGETITAPLYDTTQMVPEEAKVLAAAVSRLLAGQGKLGVIRWMNERSRTTEGNPWTGRTLTKLLLSPRISGQIERDGMLLPAAWPGIITPEQQEDVKALLRRNAEQHRYPGRERRYLLSGVAECWNCQHGLRVKPRTGKNHSPGMFYYCANCRKVGRDVPRTDGYVIGRTLRVLHDPQFLADIYDHADNPEVGAEIVALEARRRTLTGQIENAADHPDVDPVLAMAALASYDRKIGHLRRQLAVTSDTRKLARMAGMTLEQWAAEPVDVRSWTVKTLFRVTILPATWRGPGWDPACIELRRKHLSPVGAEAEVDGHHGAQVDPEAQAGAGS
ncbi:recombinase family protein [Streptomyces sp. CA-111067]|uniref:recombinase family protein n=1 Tax=Streptomyces sp. CA-111067 TaxID=3240046 RepID=UPI003D98FC7E